MDELLGSIDAGVFMRLGLQGIGRICRLGRGSRPALV
jgi:hypothetical protein